MTMFRIHKKQQDILTKKREGAEFFTKQFDTAVNLITNTISMLTHANESIDREMGEITDYQNRLDETKNDLAAQKDRNEKVIRNFNALIGE